MVQRVSKKGKEAGGRSHGAKWVKRRHLGFLPSILGTQPHPAPAQPHTKSVSRIRGILLRGAALLDVSARVSLRLLQGQHHFGLFHPAGVQGRKGNGSQRGCLAPPLGSPPLVMSCYRRPSHPGVGGHCAENNLPC